MHDAHTPASSTSNAAEQVEGVHYRTSNNIMRRRTYTVHSDVRWMHTFQPIVSRASRSSHGGKPRVLWSNFHHTRPYEDEQTLARHSSRSFRGEPVSASGLRIKTGDDDSAHGAFSKLIDPYCLYIMQSSSLPVI